MCLRNDDANFRTQELRFFTNDDFSVRQSYNDPFIYYDFQIMNIIPKEKDISQLNITIS